MWNGRGLSLRSIHRFAMCIDAIVTSQNVQCQVRYISLASSHFRYARANSLSATSYFSNLLKIPIFLPTDTCIKEINIKYFSVRLF